MKNLILKTDSNNIVYFIIRVVLAIVILPHGMQKLFGLFGGYGFGGTMNFFTQNVGMPWILGFLVIVGESFGMLLLLAGIFSRLVAASLVIIMFGALSFHASNGFFMNWSGNQAGEGIEFFLLAIGMAVQVVIKGAGKWSVDGWLAADSEEVKYANSTCETGIKNFANNSW
jgi:putative oxidoreductase